MKKTLIKLGIVTLATLNISTVQATETNTSILEWGLNLYNNKEQYISDLFNSPKNLLETNELSLVKEGIENLIINAHSDRLPRNTSDTSLMYDILNFETQDVIDFLANYVYFMPENYLVETTLDYPKVYMQISRNELDNLILDNFGTTFNLENGQYSSIFKMFNSPVLFELDNNHLYIEFNDHTLGNLPTLKVEVNSATELDTNLYLADITLSHTDGHSGGINMNLYSYEILLNQITDDTGQNSYIPLRMQDVTNTISSLTEEILNLYASSEREETQFKFDYTNLLDISDYVDTLKDKIQSVELINDADKNNIASYIRQVIFELSQKEFVAHKNEIKVSQDIVDDNYDNLLTSKEELENILDEDGITLNEEVELEMQINVQALNLWEPITINFSEVTEQPEDMNYIITLGSNQYAIGLSSEFIENYADYKIVINYKPTSTTTENVISYDGQWIVSFLDPNDKKVDELPIPITLYLPAKSLNTIVLFNDGDETYTWGGQYDEINNNVKVDIKFAGTYTLKESIINITDIDYLTDELQEMINFVVSREIFTTEESLFNPEESLNRYEFVQALVQMFYAFDPNATTNFRDILDDDKYYKNVASGEQGNLIAGFEDNTFRGEQFVSKEQLLAFCSRVLLEAGFIFDEDTTDEYLAFIDNSTIANWAKNAIALTVREGLSEYGGMLSPKNSVSRAEATEILYKLFMMLYPTFQDELIVPENIPPEESNDNSLLPFIACFVVGAILGGIFLGKKK